MIPQPRHGRGRRFEPVQVHHNVSNDYLPSASQTFSHRSPTGVQTSFDAWAAMGTVWVSMLPTPKLLGSMSWRDGAPWAPFFTLVVCWRGQQLLSFIRMLPSAHLLADEAIFRGLRKTPAHRGEQPPGGVNRRPEEAFCWVEPIRSSTSRPLQPATSRFCCRAFRSAEPTTRDC